SLAQRSTPNAQPGDVRAKPLPRLVAGAAAPQRHDDVDPAQRLHPAHARRLHAGADDRRPAGGLHQLPAEPGLPAHVPARGLHRVPPLTAETRFPLGTFRVWTVWRPAAQVLVYPAPEPHPPPLPAGEPRAGSAAVLRVPQHGDFEGVRAYRRGDALKLVVW